MLGCKSLLDKMSEYDNVNVRGKLKLKGETKKLKKRKHKTEKSKDEVKKFKIVDEDAIKHGGWWKITSYADITGSVAIQFGKRAYVKALDNGLFTLGAPHDEGEGPAPEEILTAVHINGNKIAFKSGYGKYLKVEKDGIVTGRSDAIGVIEQWEPVFQNNKMALLSDTGCFMSIDPDDDVCIASTKKVGEDEILIIRSCAERENSTKLDETALEEKGNLAQVEVNFVKKFQKFQDKKILINKSDVVELETAKSTGKLHETLLDRRSKMKADRYCK